MQNEINFFFFSHENISFFFGCILRNVLKALKTTNEVFFVFFFSVAANLRKVIDNPPSSKSMMFPLVSVDSTIQLFSSV